MPPACGPPRRPSQALDWVDRLSAQGSTDINRALLEAAAMADRERPTYLIFLTDGLPTEGVVDSQTILDNFQASRPGQPAPVRLWRGLRCRHLPARLAGPGASRRQHLRAARRAPG